MLWVIGGLAIGDRAAALTRGGVTDRVLMVAGLVGVSMPVFWVGEMANLITQSRMHDSWLFSWVPPLGYTAADRGSLAVVQDIADPVGPRWRCCIWGCTAACCGRA